MKQIVINSPLGRLGLFLEDEQVHGLRYLDNRSSLQKPNNHFVHEVVNQLDAYFSDACFQFNLPISFSGTEFQQKVWKKLQTITSGQTNTYSEIGSELGSGARAVGNACRKNPVSIIVPCHRVVSVKGIGGYGGKVDGKSLDRKRWLLRHEGIEIT